MARLGNVFNNKEDIRKEEQHQEDVESFLLYRVDKTQHYRDNLIITK